MPSIKTFYLLQKLKLLLRYIKYYFQAETKYQVHSPFVFEFALNVLEDDREYYAFQTVEFLRGFLEKK